MWPKIRTRSYVHPSAFPLYSCCVGLYSGLAKHEKSCKGEGVKLKPKQPRAPAPAPPSAVRPVINEKTGEAELPSWKKKQLEFAANLQYAKKITKLQKEGKLNAATLATLPPPPRSDYSEYGSVIFFLSLLMASDPHYFLSFCLLLPIVMCSVRIVVASTVRFRPSDTFPSVQTSLTVYEPPLLSFVIDLFLHA
jgi:hypothetical protein